MENTSALIIKANGTTTMAELLVKKKKKKKEKRKRKKRKKEANGAVKRFSRRSAIKKTFVLKLGETWTSGLNYLSRFYRSGNTRTLDFYIFRAIKDYV